MRILPAVSTLYLAASLGACTAGAPPAPPAERTNTATQTAPAPIPLRGPWRLESIGDRTAEKLELQEATLQFDNGGETFGTSGCNRFFGNYENDARGLRFGTMGVTRMACPPEMDEEALLQVFDATRNYRINGQTLILLDGAGKPLANWVQMP